MSVSNLIRRLMLRPFRSRKTAPIRTQAGTVGRGFEQLEDRTVPAQTLTWVGDVDANWNTNNAGNTNWSGDALPASGDTLVFDGTGTGLTLTNDTTAGNTYALQFTANGYTINGNQITVNPTTTGTAFGIQLTTGQSIVNTDVVLGDTTNTFEVQLPVGPTPNLILGGVISGGAGNALVKTSGGQLNLANSANSYTGQTTINGGLLAVTADGALGSTAGGTTVSVGGTLVLVNVNYASAEPLELNAAALWPATGTNTFAGNIVLAADSIIFGDSNLTLTGTVNTKAGGPGLGAKLTLIPQTPPSAGVVTFANTVGDTLPLNSIVQNVGASAITFQKNVSLNIGTTTFNENVTLAGPLTFSTSGPATFGADGTKTLTISGGAVALSPAANQTVTINAATTLNSDLAFTGAGNFNVPGNLLDGGGTVAMQGSGTLTLSGTNTYTTQTSVAAGGTLVAASAAALGTTATGTSVASGATLDVQANIGTEAITVAGAGVNGGLITSTGTGTVGGAVTLTGDTTIGGDGTLNITGNIGETGGARAVTKVGTGTTTLSGTNTYTGQTNVNFGTLVAGSAAALGTTAAGTSVAGGATLDVQANIGTEALAISGVGFGSNGSLVTSTGTGTVGGAVTLNTDVFIGGAGALNITGNIGETGGARAVTKVGTGTTTLSGTNTYTGTTFASAGILALAGGAAIPDAGAVSINSGGTLQLNASETIGSLAGAGGTVNLQANTLTTGDGTSTTYGGVIQGASGGLVKQGAGTFTLTGANTYTGTTTVSAGTLLVNGNQVAATGAVGVDGILGGIGSVGGAVTVHPGGIITGATTTTVGTLTTASLAATGGAYQADITGPGTSDVLSVTGTANLAGLDLQLNGVYVPTSTDTFTILTAGNVTGTFNGKPDGATVLFNGRQLKIHYTATSVTLGTADTLTANIVGNDLVIGDSAGVDDDLIVKFISPNLVITSNGNSFSSSAGGTLSPDGKTLTIDPSTFPGKVIFNLAGGKDTLTVDEGPVNNSGVIVKGIDFNGGLPAAPPGDLLRVVGGSFAKITHDMTGASTGDVDFGVAAGKITYTGLEPVDMTGTTATDLVFNLPAAPLAGGETFNNVIVSDFGIPGDGFSKLTSVNATPTFELTKFSNPTGSLTINRGTAGDTVGLDALTGVPDFTAALTVGTVANPFAAVDLGGQVTLANKALNVTAGVITLSNGKTFSTGGGDITLTADKMGLDNGNVNAGTGKVFLQTLTAARPIQLDNTAGDPLNALRLSNGEVNKVSGAAVVIGGATSGDITVASPITVTGTNTLHLATGGAIGQTGGGLTVGKLALEAVTGIGAALAPISVAAPGGVAINLAVRNTTSGVVNIAENGANPGGIVLTGVGSLDGVTAGRELKNLGGATTFTANSPFSYAANFSSAGTITTTTVDDNPVNVDNITVNAGVTVSSTGADVVFQAGDDIIINGTATVSATAGNVTLESGFTDTDNEGTQSLNGAINASTTTGVVTINVNGQQAATEGATGSISANGLRLLGTTATGSFALTAGTNDVNTIAASTNNAGVNYTDTNALTVGTVTTIGITTQGGGVGVTAGGNLILTDPTDAGAGNATLAAGAGATITQTVATRTVTAAGINLTGPGGIGTNAQAIVIDATTQLDASTTNSDVFITDNAGGVSVGQINAGAGNVTLTSTANTGAGTANIVAIAANNNVPEIIGNVVSLDTTAATAITPPNGQIGLPGTFFEVDAKVINASTNNSNFWISEVGAGVGAGAKIGLVTVGTTTGTVTGFLRVRNGGTLTSQTIDGTADVIAPVLNFSTVAGDPGNFGTSTASPLEIDAATLNSNLAGGGSLFVRDTAGGLTVQRANTIAGSVGIETASAAANLVLGNASSAGSVVVATGGTATLTATGSVTSSAPAGVTDVTAADLIITAPGGVGTGVGTVATTPLETVVGRLDASTAAGTAGGVYLVNTGALQITDLNTTAATIRGGNIAAQSPLTISANQIITADMAFTAGNSAAPNDDLTTDSGAVLTLNSATPLTLTLNAGDDVIFNTGSVAKGVGAGPYTVNINADLEGVGVADGDRGSVTQTGVTTSVTADTINIVAADGIGTSAAVPFVFDGGTLTTDSSGNNGNQFLSEVNTVTVPSPAGALNAGTGNITLAGGTFVVNGSATATTLTVAPGATLGGTGTINANVIGGGTVSPGDPVANPGTLTINGSFTPTGTIAFQVNPPSAAAGTDYDQIVVNPAVPADVVNLIGATLTFTGSTSPPLVAPFQVTTLIANNTANPTVASATPSEGTSVVINGNTYRIFYNGGDGNNVVLINVGATAPTTVYVNDDWATLSNGTFIPDADPLLPGNQPGVKDVNAFGDIQPAITAVAAGGTVEVLGNSPLGTGYAAFTVNKAVNFVLAHDKTAVGGKDTQDTVNLTGAVTLTGANLTAGLNHGAGTVNLTTTAAATITGGGTESVSITTGTANTGSVTLGGAVSNVVGVTLGAAGTPLDKVSLVGVSTGNGGLSVNSNGTTTLNANISTDSGNVTIAAAGNLLLAASVTIDTEQGANSVGGAVDFTGTTQATATAAGLDLTIDTSTTGFAGGAVTLGTFGNAGGSLVRNLSVTSTGTPGGTITFATGSTVDLANDLTLNAGTGNAVLNNATFGNTSLNNFSITAQDVNGSGNITLTGGLTVTNTGTASTLSGVIAGAAATVTKGGAGSLALSGANTYGGLTSVNAGTLIAANNSALGAAATGTTVAGTATLDVQANIGTEPITIGGNGVGGNGTLVSSTTGTVGGIVTLLADSSIGGTGTLDIGGVITDGAGVFKVTKVGAGLTRVTGANTYDGGTDVNAGTLLVNNLAGSGTGTGAVTVNAASLGGIGTIAGPVSLTAATSKISGGTFGTVGTLTINNSLTATSGEYQADFNGNTSDTLVVSGAINATGGTFTKLSQTGVATPATVFTLINNTSAAGLITGTFANAAEGGADTINTAPGFYTYQGAATGNTGIANDFTFVATGAPTLAGSGNLEVRYVSPAVGQTNIQLLQGGVVIDSRPRASVAGVYTVNGSAGADSLLVNYTTTAPATGYFPTDITFAGGAGVNTLNVSGGTFTQTTYNHANGTSGTIQNTAVAGNSTITYSSVTGPIVNTGTAANVVFNLTAGADTATLQDDGTFNNSMSRLSSGGTFVAVDFRNPTSALAINTGGGADSITVNQLKNGAQQDFDAGLTIGTSAAKFTTVTVAVSPTISAGAGNLAISGGTISLNGGGTISTQTTQLYDGPVALGAPTTVQSNGSAAITFNDTINGAFALTTNTGGTTTFQGAVGDAIALTALTTNPGGNAVINGGLVRTTGTQTYGNPVTVGTATAFNTTAGGSVTFSNTLVGAGNPAVTFATGAGDVHFIGQVAAAAPSSGTLGALTVTTARDVTADSAVFVNGTASVNASRNVAFNNGLKVRDDVAVTAQNIVVAQGLTAGGNLTLTATTQDIDLSGGVGVGGALIIPTARNVTITGNATAASFNQQAGSGTTTLTGGTLTTTGGVNITTSAVVLQSGINASGQTVSFTANGGGVNQTGNGITTKDLTLGGSGTFTLDSSTNQLAGVFRANVTGPVTLRVAENLTIDGVNGVSTGGGDLNLRAGRDFVFNDPRDNTGGAGSKYSTPLITAGKVIIVPGLAGTSNTQFDAEIQATSVQLGNPNPAADKDLFVGRGVQGVDTGLQNASGDIFRIHPSRLSPQFVIYGNTPATAPGDRIVLITGDPRLTTPQLITEGRNGQSVFGRISFKVIGDPTDRSVFFAEIESFEGVALEAFAVQTGPASYALQVQQTLNGSPSNASVRGGSLAANPFVVSPASVNPVAPFSAPTLAFADVNGDGTTDLIIANGSNDVPLVTIIDGQRLLSSVPLDLKKLVPSDLVSQFFAFGTDAQGQLFTGGLSVAAADFNGDGRAEVVVGAGNGGGARVEVWQFNPAATSPFQAMNVVNNFFAYADDPNFRGGVNVATGLINNDTTPDLIVGAGVGGGPRVKVFSGMGGPGAVPMLDFLAYDSTLRGGVLVAGGNFDARSGDEILTGPGYGGAPNIRVWRPADRTVNQFGRLSIDLILGPDGQPLRDSSGLPVFQPLLSFFAPGFALPGAPGLQASGTGGNTGIGAVSFGIEDPNTGGQQVLVSSARGERVQIRSYTFKANADATAFELIVPDTDVIAKLAGPGPLLDTDTNTQFQPSELFDGGTVAGANISKSATPQ